jgi:hypothetical protein
MRAAAGLPPLEPDFLLSETAREHAADLASRGAISHTGRGGSTILDRWRAAGGTSLRVGEIVGAGESVREVEAAWEDSPSHRSVVLDPLWTHLGWGSASRGSTVVYVVVFSRIRTRNLAFGWEGGQFLVRGSFLPLEAGWAVLFCGMLPLEPVSWDPTTRDFKFHIAAADFVPYLRLGYRTDSGALILTDTITPGRE